MAASPITKTLIKVAVKVNEQNPNQIDGIRLRAYVAQQDGGAVTLFETGGGTWEEASDRTNAQALVDALEAVLIQQRGLAHVGNAEIKDVATDALEFSVNAHGAVQSPWETKFLPAACDIADAYGDAVAKFRSENPEAFAV